MEIILETVINALVASSFNALLAVGFVLIFGVMGIINFAHGALYMVGAYVLWFLYSQQGWPFLGGVAAAFLFVGALGLIMERWLFRPMLHNPLGGLIISIGVLFILEALAIQLGGVGRMKQIIPAFPGVFEFLPDIEISNQRLAGLIITVVLLIAMWAFLTRTRVGWGLRAVAQDREAAALQGINIHRASMIAVGLGVAIAGLAGALMAPLTLVNPYMGHHAIITAFIVVVVGGIGSLSGAVLAAVLYGFLDTFVTTYVGGVEATIAGLVLMLLVLVIKPTGLMGRRAT